MTVEIEKPEVKRSVTEGDIPPGDGVYALNFLPTSFFGIGGLRAWTDGLLPDLQGYWSPYNDQILASTTERPGFWAGAVSIAISQLGSKAWELDGGGPTQRARAQELFHGANAGQGHHHFIAQCLMDYFTTDNGLFVEVARASDNPGAKITGIYHLDSLRCRRTGNPWTPVIYQNQWTGEWHYLKWYQVFSIAHDPNPRANYVGIGKCAARYAYDRIRVQEAIERFTLEKITGGSPHEMTFINLHETQLEGIFQKDSQDRAARKMFVYRGHTVVPAIAKDKIETVSLKLASLPDNYDADKELSRTMLAFANALGIDPQDLMPLASSNLGTSTQSLVLHQKAKGRGAAWFMEQWKFFLDNFVLPNLVRLHFIERDLDDELKRAQVEGQQITNVMMTQGAQSGPILTQEQALNKLVDENVFPKEYLPQDITPNTTLEDDEKPEMEAATADDLVNQVQQIPQQLQQTVGVQ